MTVRRDVGVNVASNLVLAVLGVASGAIVARWFGPDGRGSLSAAQVAIGVAAAFGSLGLGDALLYRTATGRPVGIGSVVRLTVLAAAAAAVLGAALGTLVGSWLDGVDIVGFGLLIALGAGAYAALNVQQGLARGASGFLSWNLARIAAALAWIAGIVAGRRLGDPSLWLLAVVFGALVAVVAVAQGAANVRRTPTGPPQPTGLRALLAFGVPSAFSTIPAVLNARVDQFALAFVSSTAALGYYAAGVGYCWAVVPLAQAVANLIFTRVAEKRDHAARVAVLRRLAGAGTTLVLGSTVVAWLLAPWALPLLNSPEFGPAIPVARVLLLGAAFQGVTLILEEGARGLDAPRLAMRAEMAGLVAMVLLLVVAVRHGPVPTAWASTGGFAVSFVVAVIGVSRRCQEPWWRLVRPSFGDGLALLSRHDR